MDRVQVTEADTTLQDLLDRVEGGEDIVLMRNGKDVARLVDLRTPFVQTPSLDRQATAVARAKTLRDKIAARGEVFSSQEIKEMRDEGRR